MPAPTSELRAALVWETDRLGAPRWAPSPCENGAATVATGFVAQEVELQADFPAIFSLNVTEFPPAEAMFPVPNGFITDGTPAGRWAAGQVIIYEDGNGNGQLDRSRPFETSIDRVLGASSPDRTSFGARPNAISHMIVFSEKRLPEYPGILEQGFNLLRMRTDDLGVSIDGSGVPLDTTVDVELSDDLRVQVQGCEVLCVTHEDYPCPQTPAELPDGGEGKCLPAFETIWAAYDWSRFACSDCVCVTHACRYPLDPKLPVPADWPCDP
jgi:hypothetical protein